MTDSFLRRLAAASVSLASLAFLVACGGGGASSSAPPAVVPTTVPTATPTTSAQSPQTNASTLTFGSGSAQSLSVSEPGYTGSYTESDTCSPLTGAIAQIATSSNGSGRATYVVTPLGAGTCTITFTDSAQRSANVSVSVSIAAITVQ